MRKRIKYVLLGAIFLTTFSCKQAKWIAPPYTSVEKIIQVKKGMTIEQANKTLGIEPYNVYNLQADGSSILIYHYRTKVRRMTVPRNYVKKEQTVRGEERSQTEGVPWYNKEHNLLYVLFEDGKVKSLLTDQGRSDAEYLLLVNNNIKSITQKELTTFRETVKRDKFTESLVVPLSDTYKKTEEAKPMISLSNKDKKRSKKLK